MAISEATLKLITEVGVLTFTGIISIIIVLLRKKILKNILKIAETIWRIRIYTQNHYLKSDVERDIRIQDILAELRLASKADRSYILQFHNGSVFTAKNQMWRISCTHESVNPGIRPCIGELQNILSSSVSELLYPLWTEDLSNALGVMKISPASCGCSTKDGCRLPKGVYLYIVEKLPEGYSKGLLLSEAITYVLASPILDSDNNRVGIIGLDYCWKDANIEEIMTFAEKLCQTSSRISFELRKRSSNY